MGAWFKKVFEQVVVDAAGKLVILLAALLGGLVLLTVNLLKELPRFWFGVSIAAITVFLCGAAIIFIAWLRSRRQPPLTEQGRAKVNWNYAELTRLGTEGRTLALHDDWAKKKRPAELAASIEKWRTESFWLLKLHIGNHWPLRTFWELAQPWDPKAVSVEDFRKALNQLEIIASDYHDIMTTPAPRQLTRTVPHVPAQGAGGKNHGG